MSDEVDKNPEPPAFSPPVRKLAVYYDFVRRDGSQGKTRMFLDWVADIRLSADLVALESRIVEVSGGELISALITSWAPLEG